jgi:hypothetical protein
MGVSRLLQWTRRFHPRSICWLICGGALTSVVTTRHPHDKNLTTSWFGDFSSGCHILRNRRWVSHFGGRCSGVVSYYYGWDFMPGDDFGRRLSCHSFIRLYQEQAMLGAE